MLSVDVVQYGVCSFYVTVIVALKVVAETTKCCCPATLTVNYIHVKMY